jgi:sigma-B regulation protein RsbU (phosphoserine phosphatase)
MDDVLNKIPCGTFSFTDQGELSYVNNTLCTMLGFTKEVLAQKKVEDIFTLATRIFYHTHFFPLLRMQGMADEIFLTLQTKDKEDIPVLLNAMRFIRNEKAENLCVCITISNRRKYEDEIITAKNLAEEALQKNSELTQAKNDLQKHAEELDKRVIELEHRNEELAQINSILSHDLQEPLRKISVFTDLLQTEIKDTASIKGLQSIEKIIKTTGHMRSIIQGLQKFLLLEGDNIKLTGIDLNGLLKTILQNKITSSELANVKMNMANMPVIEGNKDQLMLLFSNLIDNAIKFRKIKVPLLISIEGVIVQNNTFKNTKAKYKYNDFAMIRFSDNGIGFDDKYQKYVFQYLKKLNSSTEGLGVGLAFCKKIVENHYGSISVHSAVNKGTVFTILLPVKQPV